MAATRAVLVRNTQAAVRGLFDAGNALVNLEPGQERSVVLNEAAFENAVETGYFTFDGLNISALRVAGGSVADDDSDPENDDDLDVSVPKLEAIAADEGV